MEILDKDGKSTGLDDLVYRVEKEKPITTLVTRKQFDELRKQVNDISKSLDHLKTIMPYHPDNTI